MLTYSFHWYLVLIYNPRAILKNPISVSTEEATPKKAVETAPEPQENEKSISAIEVQLELEKRQHASDSNEEHELTYANPVNATNHSPVCDFEPVETNLYAVPSSRTSERVYIGGVKSLPVEVCSDQISVEMIEEGHDTEDLPAVASDKMSVENNVSSDELMDELHLARPYALNKGGITDLKVTKKSAEFLESAHNIPGPSSVDQKVQEEDQDIVVVDALQSPTPRKGKGNATKEMPSETPSRTSKSHGGEIHDQQTILEEAELCKLFLFDSLNIKHSRTTIRLRQFVYICLPLITRYLRIEALQKRHTDVRKETLEKNSSYPNVPQQPNFWY